MTGNRVVVICGQCDLIGARFCCRWQHPVVLNHAEPGGNQPRSMYPVIFLVVDLKRSLGAFERSALGVQNHRSQVHRLPRLIDRLVGLDATGKLPG